jgi:hypothetical protein
MTNPLSANQSVLPGSEPLLVARSLPKALKGLIGCAIFVAGAVILLCNVEDFLLGYWCLALFGFHGFLWLGLLSRRTRVELNADHLNLHTTFHSFSYRWEDVNELRLYGMGSLQSICLRVSPSARRHGPFQMLHRAVSGSDDFIPDVFEMNPWEMLGVLESRQEVRRKQDCD